MHLLWLHCSVYFKSLYLAQLITWPTKLKRNLCLIIHLFVITDIRGPPIFSMIFFYYKAQLFHSEQGRWSTRAELRSPQSLMHANCIGNFWLLLSKCTRANFVAAELSKDMISINSCIPSSLVVTTLNIKTLVNWNRLMYCIETSQHLQGWSSFFRLYCTDTASVGRSLCI